MGYFTPKAVIQSKPLPLDQRICTLWEEQFGSEGPSCRSEKSFQESHLSRCLVPLLFTNLQTDAAFQSASGPRPQHLWLSVLHAHQQWARHPATGTQHQRPQIHCLLLTQRPGPWPWGAQQSRLKITSHFSSIRGYGPYFLTSRFYLQAMKCNSSPFWFKYPHKSQWDGTGNKEFFYIVWLRLGASIFINPQKQLGNKMQLSVGLSQHIEGISTPTWWASQCPFQQLLLSNLKI